MKTRYLSLIVTFVLLLLVVSLLFKMREPAVTLRLNDPDNPYIYYYSDIKHAFVIERADGTDSRLLGQNVMPDNHDVIASVHWSPSGEYLAWRGSVAGHNSIRGWVVSSDGQHVSHLLDDANDVFLMQWSPNQDWLAIGFLTSPNYDTVIRLIDVPSDRIVTEMKMNHDLDPPLYLTMPDAWSQDGSALYFTFNSFKTTVVNQMQLNGHLESWYFNELSPFLDFHQERLMLAETEWRDGEHWVDWYIVDLTTRNHVLYSSLPLSESPHNRDFDFWWNPDRQYAIVYEKECEPEYRSPCEFLEAFVFNWEDGTKHLLEDDLRIIDLPHYDSRESIWSPDGQWVLLENSDQILHIYDVANHTSHSIGLDKSYYWNWLPDDTLMLVSQSERHIYRYQRGAEAQQLHEVEHNHSYFNAAVSSNGQLIGIEGTYEVVVENLETSTTYTYPLPSASVGPVMDFKLGLDDKWFFSGSNTHLAGGGFSSSAIMIHQLDVPFGRELTECYDVATCVGFLPDNVIPHLAEGQSFSHTPQPLYTLMHDTGVMGAEWSPDGHLLATYRTQRITGENTFMSALFVWDAANDFQLLFEYNMDVACEYALGCHIDWLSDNAIEVYYERTTIFQRINITTGAIENLEHSPDTLSYRVDYVETDNELQIVDIDTEETLAILPVHQNYDIRSEPPIRVSGSSGLVMNQRNARDTDQYLSFWNGDAMYNLDGYSWADAFTYHRDTNLLVGAYIYGRGAIWYVPTGEQLSLLNWTGATVAFNPDGSRLAVASSQFVTIWDMTPYWQNE